MLSPLSTEFKLLIIFACILELPACGTLDNSRYWGQDATITPSLTRMHHAAVTAAKHPGTWSPLLAATILSMGNLDKELSAQLSDNTPLFGSNEDADDASDWLRDSLVASVAISALAMPGGENSREHAINKTKGLITEVAALKVTSLATSGLKDITDRERPNRANNKSFPSGHTSRAFAAAALTSKNLESLSLDTTTETGIRIGVYSFATAAAWARVEANVHYATDVLAGAALGNFLSRFIHDAFLGLESNTQVQIEVLPRQSQLNLQWRF